MSSRAEQESKARASSPGGSSRWTSRLFHALLLAILLTVVGFRVYRYFTTSETEIAARQAPVAAQGTRQLRETARDAFRNEDWLRAAEAYGKILTQDSDNVRVRIRLAHALHSSDQYDSALNHYLILCRFDGDVRRWALYNIACVYALKGDKRLALDYLSEAAEEGYRMNRPASADADFASLVDDPEFKRLSELLRPVSQRDVYRRYDFLVGRWVLLGGDEQRIGALTVSKTSDGYALRGQCNDESRSVKITFFAYYDPETKHWRQLWLDDRGSLIELQEESSEDESLTLRGHHLAANGKRKLARARYTEGKDRLMSLELASSINDGKSWQPWLSATLVPQKTAEPNLLEHVPKPD